MIVNKTLLEEIKKFGLNSYEAKIWTALLSRGISTAGELAEIANVPRSRSYDVLESLEKKGFIMMKIGKPIKYLAIKPDQVLERVQKKVHEDAEFNIKKLETLKDSDLLTNLTNLHEQGIEILDPLNITALIRGRTNINYQLGFLIKNAKDSVKIITSDEGLIRKITELKKQLITAKNNDVKITFSSPNKKLSTEHKKTIQTIGNHITTENDSRMMLIDNKEIMIMLAKDTEINAQYDTAIWINSEFLGNSLNKIFN